MGRQHDTTPASAAARTIQQRHRIENSPPKISQGYWLPDDKKLREIPYPAARALGIFAPERRALTSQRLITQVQTRPNMRWRMGS